MPIKTPEAFSVTREKLEAPERIYVTREIDAHGEALKRAIELGLCLKCGCDSLHTELHPRNITFKCYITGCGWSAIYPIRTIGNSERAQRDADQELSIHQLVEIRSAVLRVIDDGCNCGGEKHPWDFYEDGTEGGNIDAYTEDMANANRLRFVDAIQSRLTAALKGNG